MHEAPCISLAFLSRHCSPSLKCFFTYKQSKIEHCEQSNMAFFRVILIGVREKMKKIPFLTKFLATVCFFTFIFSMKTRFCACIRKIGIKSELLAQPASFWGNFVAKANISWLKICYLAKNYIRRKHPVFLWHLWVATARQAKNALSLISESKTITVSDQFRRILAYFWTAWMGRCQKQLFDRISCPCTFFYTHILEQNPYLLPFSKNRFKNWATHAIRITADQFLWQKWIFFN